MWPFALVSLACLPFLGWAQSLEMEKTMGKDETSNDDDKLDAGSPGGIAVETLLNMGTVSALTLQEERYTMYEEALENSDQDWLRIALKQGVLAGLSMGIQQWINAVQIFFGGWLMFKHPDKYSFSDFLIAMFALLFGLFGLGLAFQDITDRKETEQSASRIFYLMDRQSEIDPLSEEGKTVDYSVPLSKPKKKKSVAKRKSEKKKRESSLKIVAEDETDDAADEGEEVQTKRSSSSKKKKSKRSSKIESGDGAEKKSKKKRKSSKKKDSQSDEIMFVPTEDGAEEAPANVSAMVEALEKKDGLE